VKGKSVLICIFIVALLLMGPFILLHVNASRHYPLQFSLKSNFQCELSPKNKKPSYKNVEETLLALSFVYSHRYSSEKSRLLTLKTRYFKKIHTKMANSTC